jgi:hypothetical protein
VSSGGEPVAEHFNGILYCSVSYNSVKEYRSEERAKCRVNLMPFFSQASAALRLLRCPK